jgi:hypothetical protein
VRGILAPTDTLWVIGRTYSAGKSDYEAVHAIQQQYQLAPLSKWGKSNGPQGDGVRRQQPIDRGIPPVVQVDKLGATAFFDRMARMMEANPPAGDDDPILDRLALLGILPASLSNLGRLPASIADAVEAGVAAARARLHGTTMAALAKAVNGLAHPAGPGALRDQLRAPRAGRADGAGREPRRGRGLSGDRRRRQRPSADGREPLSPPLPARHTAARQGVLVGDPVRADHFLAANPLGRYALGDRDPMRADPTGRSRCTSSATIPAPNAAPTGSPPPPARST